MKKPSSHHSLCFCIILILQLFPAGVLSDDDHSTVVEFLPGFHGRLPFILHTGYIGVGKNEEVQLFYYFVKSESNPNNDPLILWLTGGPGCSSISGLLYELGPLEFEDKQYNGSLPTLLLAPHSMTKVASIIYLDQPANTGFSYATTPNATTYTDLQACDHVYEFLQKWFSNNPDFISNSLYIAGDSYSGITVPIIFQLILSGNEAGNKPMMNLKGYSLGNPKTFPGEVNYSIPFAHGMGLISTELYTSLAENCKEEYEDIGWRNELCSQNYQMIDGINDQHILEPSCGSESALINPGDNFSGKRRSLEENFMSSNNDSWCRVDYRKLSNYWANDPKVQEALHVRKGSIGQWLRCRQSISIWTYRITLMDTIQYHVNISRKGYRSLIYSGDHDMCVPFQSTEAWIKSLKYAIIDEWRPWIVNSQVAGYTRSYSNQMTFATLKGAGHVAFEYKREESVAMLTRWLSYQPL
ncbi:serine carboxypeptidase-like 11 isoform X2 [Ipomoea triloba]|uniref:serine carboxypeptidase-like 11 isoform X2 n=1 Tax=Ipomoea triloba TaxID=35885 RepID=UPI00125DF6FE|nr:serine carboxypeptidase-like 11 isoform X2 [Ipomoea triloba]